MDIGWKVILITFKCKKTGPVNYAGEYNEFKDNLLTSFIVVFDERIRKAV